MSCEFCSAIHEVPVGIEVFRPDPSRRLGGMTSLRPPPQLGVDMVIGRVERILRCTVPIVGGPAPDHRTQVADYLAGCGLPMLAQIVADAAEMAHQFCFLRSRQNHAFVAPHGEAKEVKALVDVDDPGLRFTQPQPSLSQKGGELGMT